MSVFVVWSLFFLAVRFEKIYGKKTEKFPLLYFAASFEKRSTVLKDKTGPYQVVTSW